MKAFLVVSLLSVMLDVRGSCQVTRGGEDADARVKQSLKQTLRHFGVKAASFRDGVSRLSSMPVVTLHLGFEEIFRPKFEELDRTILFSLSLENSTVNDVLDALCTSDSRYTWSTDGSSINIYPRATIGDPKYLPNLRLARIAIANVSDPYRVLDPLMGLLPGEQLGYMHLGPGDTSYAEPWTVAFEHVTVRQLMNRVAEHMGPRSSWILQGTAQDRFFSFEKGAFYTQHGLEGQ